ncbi:MAG: hypothetical protein EB127_24475 [Alphaproteobacteria bacterium]|nr:hypothetical protein [Alphaproteobacteria bacterium]
MKSSPKCKSLLQQKIRINMGERKERNWSVPQALAISYSQIRKKYPECQFKKSSKRRRSSSPKRRVRFKSPVRIKAKKGGLHEYSLKMSLKERRSILDRLVKVYGRSNIIKKLNLLY